jgi:hypothetical protein
MVVHLFLNPTSKDPVLRKTVPERPSLTQNSELAKKSSDALGRFVSAACESRGGLSYQRVRSLAFKGGSPARGSEAENALAD